ncbi:DEAD/DEAH box helicase [Granulicoccus phenolivorans]|uniref:DEAD/DEAH box helicase n=1 Tax=Granulicoccus phenolivorans TaxID=266854 RepID=UPI000424ECCD|nr:DEAD/DEAH box helicase [Granulicoccus phenolivorans]
MDSDVELSPAERMARFKARQRSPLAAEFADGYGFEFDPFQQEACAHIEAGRGVLVAAPTGAGKTIAGEFAVWLARKQGKKAFYTTPIKALSNQKYNDFVATHGADHVGLLTGDTSINSEAPIVVMTTEVLRNMIYARSATLEGLGYVVMDEVHYLADRFRGAVWEEVIIGLAESVQLVALSATVSNAEEFGDWLAEVRGDSGSGEPGSRQVEIVVSERRPVPLYQHVLVGRRLYDLFEDEAPTAITDATVPQRRAEVNPALLRVSKQEARIVRDDSRHARGRSGRGKRGRPASKYGGDAHRSHTERSQHKPASRADIVRTLENADLLPAIIFIFSRVGCDAAVKQMLGSQLRLTNSVERAEILHIAAEHTAGLTDADLAALEYDTFLDALERGIAAHHAGMLPVFKECVEECFVRGLIKVVCATETLALGINMPARSVVLEKLVKYNGETHADITPGEYTQLTGRAGRRGIDTEGHAVVLWQPGFDPRAVAGLASKRTYPLKSSFHPTYNMAVNMIGAVGRDHARSLLEQSFAQYQTDRSVVGLARTVQRNTEKIDQFLAQAECDRGDFAEYAHLRAEISDLEAEAARSRKVDRRAEAYQSLLELSPGDIIHVPTGKMQGWAVILDPGVRSHREEPHPLILAEDRQTKRLTLHDFPTPVKPVGRIRIPKHFSVKEAHDRRSLAAALRSKLGEIDLSPERWRPGAMDELVVEQIAELRHQLATHPCHRCPDREEHARLAERAIRLERENQGLEDRMAKRTNTIAVHFDRICVVLDAFGYLAGGPEAGTGEVTPQGRMLARIYNELDLVAAECVRRGVFDDLSVPQLAAVLSCLVYEARRDRRNEPPRMPDQETDSAIEQVRAIHREVSLAERDTKLERGPEPEAGFAEAAYAWAAGRPLSTVLRQSGLTAGDFVRWVRQVIDFADQVGNAAAGIERGELRAQCRAVVRAMRRGVVAYQSDQ